MHKEHVMSALEYIGLFYLTMLTLSITLRFVNHILFSRRNRS